MRTILVVGLGRFGKALVRALTQEEVEVIAIDPNPVAVDEIKELVHYAVAGDLRDRQVLEELCQHGVDAAIVAVADQVAESALATMILKELGVPDVLARSERPDQQKLLGMVGADRIVEPIAESASRTARALASPAVQNFVIVGENFAIMEVHVNTQFVGKTLETLELRRHYGVTVIGVLERPEEEPGAPATMSMPDPLKPLQAEQVLLVIGRTRDLDKFQRS